MFFSAIKYRKNRRVRLEIKLSGNRHMGSNPIVSAEKSPVFAGLLFVNFHSRQGIIKLLVLLQSIE